MAADVPQICAEDAADAEDAEDARRRPKTPEDAEDARRRPKTPGDARRRPKTPKTPEDAEDAAGFRTGVLETNSSFHLCCFTPTMSDQPKNCHFDLS